MVKVFYQVFCFFWFHVFHYPKYRAKYKYFVLAVVIFVLILNYASVVVSALYIVLCYSRMGASQSFKPERLPQAFLFLNVIDPVTDAVASGLDASAVALAAAVGIV